MNIGAPAAAAKGIANIDISARGGPVVTTFPVTDSDQIMMVTDGMQKVIRTGVDEIRIAGRRAEEVWCSPSRGGRTGGVGQPNRRG